MSVIVRGVVVWEVVVRREVSVIVIVRSSVQTDER
jgi:hypothetical protein